MALLTQKDEIRQHASVGLALELHSIAPFAQAVEEQEVANVIGNELYDALVDAYDGGSEDITEEKYAVLLPYAQKIIVNLSVAESMDVNQVQISESGVMRIERDDEKSAYHYQKTEAQNALRRAGYQAQEGLLSFLEANTPAYPEYKMSAAYQQAQQLFISSAKQFDQQYSINGSVRTYRALMHLMRRAEQLQIRDTIGVALFDELKQAQADAQPPGGPVTPEHKTLLVYIRLAVAHLAIADAAHELSLEVTAHGVQLTQTLFNNAGSEEKKKPERGALDQLNQRTEGLGQRYLQQLRNFLLSNASATAYTAFFTSALYPKPPETAGPRDDKPPGRRAVKRRIYGAL